VKYLSELNFDWFVAVAKETPAPIYVVKGNNGQHRRWVDVALQVVRSHRCGLNKPSKMSC